MGYDYKIALETLSEQEKNRIVCLYLSCDTAAFNGIVRLPLAPHPLAVNPSAPPVSFLADAGYRSTGTESLPPSAPPALIACASPSATA